MKWSMDTHKYISEITRKAFQIMQAHKITSDSEPEEIDAVERELAEAGVYKDYESAKGRVRRALFTYFHAYSCLDDTGNVTQLGKLYAEGKLSIQEFSFQYIVNYLYEDDDIRYYPTYLVALCLKKMSRLSDERPFISSYDFSKLVDCNGESDLTDEFVLNLIAERENEHEVNERSIGFDVWAKMLVQSGILKRSQDGKLFPSNNKLLDWLIEAYKCNEITQKGVIRTGIMKSVPKIKGEISEEAINYEDEGKALAAFLFDGIDDYTINKYVISDGLVIAGIREAFGLSTDSRGFFNMFVGLERLIGYVLAASEDSVNRTIGKILCKIELSEVDIAGVQENAELTPYSKQDFLKEVFIDSDQYDLLVNLLRNRKNVILQGAPGVGKTFMAKRLAYSMLGCIDSDRVHMVQFHQSYSYEDFVVGYRPTDTGFEKAYGPFYEFCKKAEKTEGPCFFIIDEINRGNVSKIFGELLMLIEADKRGDSLKLLYTHEDFSVPENVYIIGMMNTADRSLAIIDYALRRRFAFYDVKPAFENPLFVERMESKQSDQLNRLLGYVKNLNLEIANDDSLGEGFEIGHSYFCAKDDEPIDKSWVKSVVEYSLIPLLKEYWFDDKEKAEKWTKDLRGVE